MKKILFILSLIVCFNTLKAQQDLTLYYMDNVPQRAYQNPAFRNASKFNLGLPAISSIYLGVTNTTFTGNNLFNTSGSTPVLALNDFKTKIKTNNYLGLNAKVDLLSFGFQIGKKNYISFNATENFFMRGNLPEGVLLLPISGNADFEEHNGELSFKNLGVNLSHYREYGIGFQRKWNEKLNVGVKAKYLYGMENVHFKKSDYSLNTDPDTWDWTISGEMDVRSSGLPVEFFRDSSGNLKSRSITTDLEDGEVVKYLTGRKNRGLGIDLGGEYKINDKITVNASIIDLGFINWKTYNNRFKTNRADFAYAGVDITEAIYTADSARDDTIQAIIDRTVRDFEESADLEYSQDGYNSPLLTRIHLGGTYQLYKKDKSSGTAGVLFQTEVYQRRLRPSVTLSYNQKVGRWLNASLSYSVINRSWSNIGAGVSLNLGPVQFYVAADNLLAANVTKLTDNGETQGYIPTSAKYAQIHTGLNLTFGREKSDKDKDGIVDKKDDCPETFGLAEFDGCPDTDADGVPDKLDNCPETPGTINGCPDTDKDSIIDSKDNCPEIPGLAQFNGCPDTDKDGIMDSEDSCPEVAGLKEFNGCPDTDKDGIMDKEDDCPETAGLAEFKGCPDTDKDGVADKADGCPEVAGPIENKGCPWGDKDKDGVKDNIDKCPETPGTVENNGCPFADTDGDGITDNVDKCPNVPGVKENNGCPEIKEEEKEILKKAFDNLEFETGKDIIKASSYESLDQLAGVLKKRPTWMLTIQGHTDNVGSASSNLTLSKDRAVSVKNYLISKEISTDRLETLWFGETKPIAPNNTPAGRQQNRRVEMDIKFE